MCLTILCLQCVLSELVSNWCTFVCIYRLSVCVLDCIGWLSLSCKYTTNGFLYISTIYETRFFISLLIRFLFVSIKNSRRIYIRILVTTYTYVFYICHFNEMNKIQNYRNIIKKITIGENYVYECMRASETALYVPFIY